MVVDRIETGALTAMAFVLLFSGAAKLRRPWLSGLELAVAALALLGPARLSGIALGALFAGFAAVHLRRHLAESRDDCGCLGEEPGARGPRAIWLTGIPAAIALCVAARGASSVSALAAGDPSGALLVATAAALAAAAWVTAFRGGTVTVTGAGERLVNSSALFLERRFSRRTALVRLAVTGSALAVAPLRYLLYPVSAMAAIVPGDCGGGLCTDGYTAFCCEINHGQNTCPTGTYPGGWWMCTDYAGRLLCAEQGVRYYVDCNALPGETFPGGCRCANDDCDERRVACNIFRYGQCNPQVAGVTAVVCRMVVCENPSLIPGLNCSSSLAVDDAVCGHDNPCLEPMAVQLAGAGGV